MNIKNYSQFITEARSKLDTSGETLSFQEAYDLIIGGNLKVIELQPRFSSTSSGSFRICYKSSTGDLDHHFCKFECDCIRVLFENDQEKEKILQTFKKEDNSKVLDDVEDIFIDLKTEYFELSAVDRCYRNGGNIYVGLLKDPTGNLTVEFELGEVIETLLHMIDFMKLEGFELEHVVGFNLQNYVQLPLDIESWNKSTKVLGIDLFFN